MLILTLLVGVALLVGGVAWWNHAVTAPKIPVPWGGICAAGLILAGLVILASPFLPLLVKGGKALSSKLDERIAAMAEAIETTTTTAGGAGGS